MASDSKTEPLRQADIHIVRRERIDLDQFVGPNFFSFEGLERGCLRLVYGWYARRFRSNLYVHAMYISASAHQECAAALSFDL